MRRDAFDRGRCPIASGTGGRKSAGVWDTEAAVRRAEGDEEGAREAEGMREKLRK